MSKQKKRVKKRSPVKPVVNNPLFNVHHPEFKGKFEVAFECKGIKYYRCVKDFFYPVGRYQFVEHRLAEADLRITTKLLKDYIKAILKLFDVPMNGTVQMHKIHSLLINLETHVDLEFSPMTIKRLAAVVYIDETEDVREFDEEYGEKKIKIWEENGEYGFFLTRPIGELLNASDGSEEYLVRYMKTMTDEELNLISELSSQLSEKT